MERPYIVTGYRPFPNDMLKHDFARPATEEDAAKIAALNTEIGAATIGLDEPVEVFLIMDSGEPTNRRPLGESIPSYLRWESFGWTVSGDEDVEIERAIDAAIANPLHSPESLQWPASDEVPEPPVAEQWPPAHGIPDASRLIADGDLTWGHTPFDNLTRGELLRLVQAHQMALGAAYNVLDQFRATERSAFWSDNGAGGRAYSKAEFLIDLGRYQHEIVYRNFYRGVAPLFFGHLPGVEPVGIMPNGCWVSPPNPDQNTRPLEWRDWLPGASE